MATFDGLRLILQFYRNHGALRQVENKTGVPLDLLRRFCDGENCLSPEQDAILREPLGVRGSREIEVS